VELWARHAAALGSLKGGSAVVALGAAVVELEEMNTQGVRVSEQTRVSRFSALPLTTARLTTMSFGTVTVTVVPPTVSVTVMPTVMATLVASTAACTCSSVTESLNAIVTWKWSLDARRTRRVAGGATHSPKLLERSMRAFWPVAPMELLTLAVVSSAPIRSQPGSANPTTMALASGRGGAVVSTSRKTPGGAGVGGAGGGGAGGGGAGSGGAEGAKGAGDGSGGAAGMMGGANGTELELELEPEPEPEPEPELEPEPEPEPAVVVAASPSPSPSLTPSPSPSPSLSPVASAVVVGSAVVVASAVVVGSAVVVASAVEMA